MWSVESFVLVAFEIFNIILFKSVENGKKVLKPFYTEILGLILLVLICLVIIQGERVYSCACSHSCLQMHPGHFQVTMFQN